jgi:cob(I)alamin adenosyltransferase
MSIRINKVTTHQGDKGDTSLANGTRLPKDALQVEVMGSLDECRAWLGWLQVALTEEGSKESFATDLGLILDTMQQDLFDLGSLVAMGQKGEGKDLPRFDKERILWLESLIAEWNDQVEPLTSFLLAGGGRFSTLSHLARAVCRRAERVTVALAREVDLQREVLQYLNRLSDVLFVMGRLMGKQFNEVEKVWQRPLDQT